MQASSPYDCNLYRFQIKGVHVDIGGTKAILAIATVTVFFTGCGEATLLGGKNQDKTPDHQVATSAMPTSFASGVITAGGGVVLGETPVLEGPAATINERTEVPEQRGFSTSTPVETALENQRFRGYVLEKNGDVSFRNGEEEKTVGKGNWNGFSFKSGKWNVVSEISLPENDGVLVETDLALAVPATFPKSLMVRGDLEGSTLSADAGSPFLPGVVADGDVMLESLDVVGRVAAGNDLSVRSRSLVTGTVEAGGDVALEGETALTYLDMVYKAALMAAEEESEEAMLVHSRIFRKLEGGNGVGLFTFVKGPYLMDEEDLLAMVEADDFQGLEFFSLIIGASADTPSLLVKYGGLAPYYRELVQVRKELKSRGYAKTRISGGFSQDDDLLFVEIADMAGRAVGTYQLNGMKIIRRNKAGVAEMSEAYKGEMTTFRKGKKAEADALEARVEAFKARTLSTGEWARYEAETTRLVEEFHQDGTMHRDETLNTEIVTWLLKKEMNRREWANVDIIPVEQKTVEVQSMDIITSFGKALRTYGDAVSNPPETLYNNTAGYEKEIHNVDFLGQALAGWGNRFGLFHPYSDLAQNYSTILSTAMILKYFAVRYGNSTNQYAMNLSYKDDITYRYDALILNGSTGDISINNGGINSAGKLVDPALTDRLIRIKNAFIQTGAFRDYSSTNGDTSVIGHLTDDGVNAYLASKGFSNISTRYVSYTNYYDDLLVFYEFQNQILNKSHPSMAVLSTEVSYKAQLQPGGPFGVYVYYGMPVLAVDEAYYYPLADGAYERWWFCHLYNPEHGQVEKRRFRPGIPRWTSVSFDRN